MTLWKLTYDTFEVDGPLGLTHPMLTHIFWGKTRKEAEGYAAAHEKTDTFFAGCLAGRFRDIPCLTTIRTERVG